MLHRLFVKSTISHTIRRMNMYSHPFVRICSEQHLLQKIGKQLMIPIPIPLIAAIAGSKVTQKARYQKETPLFGQIREPSLEWKLLRSSSFVLTINENPSG